MKVVERIIAFNAGRDPRRLALKYARMRKSPFAFLRGSCHLFQASLAWYADALAAGKSRWVEGETATATVADLLGQRHERRRAESPRKPTVGQGARLALRVNSGKALPTTTEQRNRVIADWKAFVATGEMPLQ
jgi:uncharacterized protein (DUF2252 family)